MWLGPCLGAVFLSKQLKQLLMYISLWKHNFLIMYKLWCAGLNGLSLLGGTGSNREPSASWSSLLAWCWWHTSSLWCSSCPGTWPKQTLPSISALAVLFYYNYRMLTMRTVYISPAYCKNWMRANKDRSTQWLAWIKMVTDDMSGCPDTSHTTA